MRLISGGDAPHAGQPIVAAGSPVAEATAALILVHGRGGEARDLLAVGEMVAPPGMACLAVQAAGHVWYPNRFIEPVGRNEPGLSSGLSVLGDLVDRLLGDGLPAQRIALLGFSQGACLSVEFARRRGQRLGAVIGLSGGLIGDAAPMPGPGAGQPLEDMPVLLACSDHDPHIPIARVRETDAVLAALGANVLLRVYPGDSHEVNGDEIALARRMLAQLVAPAPGG
jgi:predicted esterase